MSYGEFVRSTLYRLISEIIVNLDSRNKYFDCFNITLRRAPIRKNDGNDVSLLRLVLDGKFKRESFGNLTRPYQTLDIVLKIFVKPGERSFRG